MEKYYILSHPKSGRTWLQLLVGSLFSSINSNYPVDFFIQQVVNENSACLKPKMRIEPSPSKNLPNKIAPIKNNLPNIIFTHGGTAGINLDINVNNFRSKNVIVLIRDPRDTVVSYYFHMKKRLKIYNDSMTKFIRDETFGIKRIISVLNLWSKVIDIAENKMVVKYEDMHLKLCYVLNHIARFLNLNIKKEYILQAIEFCQFDKMREMETTNIFNHIALKPGNVKNEESYKTRKGFSGGYKKYLTEQDINYLNSLIYNNLDNKYYCYFHEYK